MNAAVTKFDPSLRAERLKDMENLVGLVGVALPLAALLLPIAILGIIFWYKAREREMEMHETLRVREFEHLQRLKELELEIEKLRASGPEKTT